jgi:hypothetical protein
MAQAAITAAVVCGCLVISTTANATGPPPLASEAHGGIQDPGAPPPCSANTTNGGPLQPGVDVFPCTPGQPTDEGWPSVAGSVDTIRYLGPVAGSEGLRMAYFRATGTVSPEAPGSMLAHMGASCAATGLWYGKDCHGLVSPLDFFGPAGAQSPPAQTIQFTPGDDRMWLGYRPIFVALPTNNPCTIVYTDQFLEQGAVGAATPSKVAASASTAAQPVRLESFALRQFSKPKTWHLCLGVAMDSAPPPFHQFNPFFILADRTFTAPGYGTRAKKMTFAAATAATRARLAKVRSWRRGTKRSLKVLTRDRYVYVVRARWRNRGAHPRRYRARVTVRSTKQGIRARLGHITTS